MKQLYAISNFIPLCLLGLPAHAYMIPVEPGLGVSAAAIVLTAIVVLALSMVILYPLWLLIKKWRHTKKP
jgi:hypothetical protein